MTRSQMLTTRTRQAAHTQLRNNRPTVTDLPRRAEAGFSGSRAGCFHSDDGPALAAGPGPHFEFKKERLRGNLCVLRRVSEGQDAVQQERCLHLRRILIRPGARHHDQRSLGIDTATWAWWSPHAPASSRIRDRKKVVTAVNAGSYTPSCSACVTGCTACSTHPRGKR